MEVSVTVRAAATDGHAGRKEMRAKRQARRPAATRGREEFVGAREEPVTWK
jgi:hypothetical protein